MIELAYPWALFALFLPIAVYFLFSTYKEQKDAIQVPFFQKVIFSTVKTPSTGAVKLRRSNLQRVLLFLGWCSLVVAVAKPELIGEPIEQKNAAKEIMVALDLSGSMSEQDFCDLNKQPIDRLTASKQVLAEFAQQRENDRLGLILFGDAAYLQAPFTQDIDTWLSLLNQSALGVAGWQTAIGDAIGLSVSAFEQNKIKDRVLILLTDGHDTGSKMPPIKAAEVAKKFDIKIYTIAMGDPNGKGEYKLDVDTLLKISEITGGESFQAYNREELNNVYNRINTLEKQEYETLSFRPKTSLHYVPLALYIVLNFIALLPSFYRRTKVVISSARNQRRVLQREE
ncbi:VWA domain-containing protein (plasmid) [Photobacterium sp. DA100]|uniref:vWA domain-containing protein n=1 Tax=Photobacterium sp. DA100 TaxID=3027472 RepID=UPI0024796B59|nr:VWA domain-containing protein [Photobacterium sp. DA100]WEM44304.1 VWA domain-containing protein [Photobacterium sp. DA100]